MLKIALLTTCGENAGDDLIRYGVQYILEKVTAKKCMWVLWSKSNPISATASIGALSYCCVHRRGKPIRLVIKSILYLISKFRFLEFRRMKNVDLLVICGTPLFYILKSGRFDEQESWPAMLARFSSKYPEIPIVTLGAGSIYDSSEQELKKMYPKTFRAIEDVLKIQRVTFTRDSNTYKLLTNFNEASPIQEFYCPSLWACNYFGIVRNPQYSRRHLCISFSIESAAWADVDEDDFNRKNLLSATLKYLDNAGVKYKFLAHNEHDINAFKKIERQFSLRPSDIMMVDGKALLQEIANAGALLTWRVHGAMAARSLDVPALLIRTDSRAVMAEEIGVSTVENTFDSFAAIEQFIERYILNEEQGGGENIAQIKKAALENFIKSFNEYKI